MYKTNSVYNREGVPVKAEDQLIVMVLQEPGSICSKKKACVHVVVPNTSVSKCALLLIFTCN